MFVITGATGNTGSVAAKTLLAAGKKVRVLVRDAAKAKGLAELGAEVFVGDLTDQASLARALEGAEGVSFLSPPDNAAEHFIEERKLLTQKQVDTFARAKVPHVVVLSSVAAQHAEGTGPIVSLHNVEQQLQAAGVPSTFVRAAYFVENWGAVVHPVKADGVLPIFLPGKVVFPTVSTADIGQALAQSLLDGPRGIRKIELSGPVDVSPSDVAAAFSAILGRPIQVVEAPLAAVVPTFTSFGISAGMAGLYEQMYAGMISGKVAPGDGERVRGKIPLEQTLRALLG
jgi:uncharacterized protein YbjT (DUF2867 family)